MKTEKIFITILVTLMLIGCSKGQGNIKLPIDTNNAQNDLKKAYTIELSSLAVDESLYSSEYGTYAHEGADFVKALEEGTITVTPENYFTYDKLSGEIYGYAHDAPYDEIKELVIPSMIDGNIVTGIRYESFVAMDLNKVVFPDTIRKIGNNAFEANNLTELNLPHGIEEIGRSAFQINQLTEIILPNSLTKLDEKAFSSNDIKEVYLGTGLMIGGHKVFDWSKVNVIVNESQLTMKNIGYMLDIDNGADEKQTGIIERGKQPIQVVRKEN